MAKKKKGRKLPPKRRTWLKDHLACPRCGQEIRIDIELRESRRQRG